eukprot:1160940-Pelagomonas_calceolata.AAC.2
MLRCIVKQGFVIGAVESRSLCQVQCEAECEAEVHVRCSVKQRFMLGAVEAEVHKRWGNENASALGAAEGV